MPSVVRSNQWRARARLDVEYLEGRRLLNGGPLFEIVGGFRSAAHMKVEDGRHDHAPAHGDKETPPPPKTKDNSAETHGHTTTKNKAADQKDHVTTVHPAEQGATKTDQAATLEATTANAASGSSTARPTEAAAPHSRNDGAPSRTLAPVTALPTEEENHEQGGRPVAEEETSDVLLVPADTTAVKEGQTRHLAGGFDPVFSPLRRFENVGDEAILLSGLYPTSGFAVEVHGATPQAGFVDSVDSASADAPRVSELLAAGIPFDALTLDLSLENFLKRVNEMGERLGHSLGGLPLQSWLVAAALATGACEIARRQLRHSARYRLFSAATAADSLSWSLTLTAQD